MSVVGARPQFIKAAVVGGALRAAGQEEVLVHTGQHYDREMSEIFFDQLGIPEPEANLGVGSATHGRQTGHMLIRIEEYLECCAPDVVIVYGDTNSTLAGALAAAKMGIPVAHVEAGLRSFNRDMPEEHNRVLTDHVSDLLFCPTVTGVTNLRSEGIESGVHMVGDPMYDAVLTFSARAGGSLLHDLGLTEQRFILTTIHRPYNTDEPHNLKALLESLIELADPVVFPVHPRTRVRIEALGAQWPDRLEHGGVKLIPPVGYLDALALIRSSRLVLTDSGGLQKEAYFLGVPCITLRPETEWPETLDGGWNRLLGEDRTRLVDVVSHLERPSAPRRGFGDGDAGPKIAAELISGVR